MSRQRSERGQSVNLFALLVSGALMLTVGLVVDGGQKVTATARAEAAAAGAARAASNAAATSQLAGGTDVATAVRAAKTYLDGEPGVTGSVTVRAGVVGVRTEAAAPTLFLSMIGIDHVEAAGSAEANIVATGEPR
ncbi:MAG TPA: pilus assembly protein TadE [Propionibacteriaceae bacterium]|nr:pilus assembly protein TadE [Propionibacteriaceae bacterium]